MLYIVRHGSTQLNAGDPADPRDYFRGWTNAPMSDFGLRNSEQTAKWFSNKPIDMIFSSDLARAQQMASLISKSTNVPVQTTPLARPWNIGHLTGQVITPELLGESEKYQKEIPDQPINGGESYNQFQQRYGQLLNQLLPLAQSKNVVLVAHHRNVLALENMLYGRPTAVKGPPDPSGVVTVGQKGIHQVFTPAEQEKVYKQNTTS